MSLTADCIGANTVSKGVWNDHSPASFEFDFLRVRAQRSVQRFVLNMSLKRSRLQLPTTTRHDPDMHTIIYEIPSQSTRTTQYLIADSATKHAAIIDPVVDTDTARFLPSASTAAADKLLALAEEHDYIIDLVLHTCPHSAPPTAAWYLRGRLRERGQTPKVVGAKGVEGVKERASRNSRAEATPQWDDVVDRELEEGEVFKVGEMQVRVLKLPGLSEEHVGFHVGSNVFVGELPGLGCGRLEGKVAVERAGMAWLSMQRLLALPAEDTIFASGSPIDQMASDKQASCMTVARYQHHLGDLAQTNERDFVARQKPVALLVSTEGRSSLWDKIKDLLGSAMAH